MDIGIVIGIGGGIGLIFLSCFLSGSIVAFLNLPSAVVVIGGSIASIFVCFPIESIKSCFGMLKQVIRKRDLEIKKMVDTFVEYSGVVRKNGKMGLEEMKPQDPFMIKGITFVLEDKSPDILEKLLHQERQAYFESDMQGQRIMDKFAEFSPAWGMIGTLIGLVVMMLNLSDPSSIGPSMAVALITTFYGAVFANLFFLPLATKLENRAKENFILRELMVEGMLSLAQEENPRMTQDRLMAFIQHDPVYRHKFDKEQEKE